MALRNELPNAEIAPVAYGQFIAGEEIVQRFPVEWDLKQGDTIHWEYQDRTYGFAVVDGVFRDGYVAIRKVG